MPQVTLLVCVHGDRKPLATLLERSAGCYDELLVIHDGPELEDIHSLVSSYGGRFYVRPRAYCHEPHLPFALSEASFDWILKLDSDEYPSPELRNWLTRFRQRDATDYAVSGFECIWPAWNGHKPITQHWPNNRKFLYDRRKVQIIGIAEFYFFSDSSWEKLPYVLHHEPNVVSHGLRNILGKRRNKDLRERAVAGLLVSPLEHPRWRYNSSQWPPMCEQMRTHPIFTMLRRLVTFPTRQAAGMLLAGDIPWPSVFTHSAIFHALVCFALWKSRKQIKPA